MVDENYYSVYFSAIFGCFEVGMWLHCDRKTVEKGRKEA